MKNSQVYFKNHKQTGKFPWSLYHRSLDNSLINFLHITNSNLLQKILIIGPGAFSEESIIKNLNYEVDVLDIDKRVLVSLENKKINRFIWSEDGTLSSIDSEAYDAVYAKEVIEHIIDYRKYLGEIQRILKPGGKVWLSTPNYGFFLLPLLENTFLELYARLNMYSRKAIHPSKFSAQKLYNALLETLFKNIDVKESEFKLALIATFSKKH